MRNYHKDSWYGSKSGFHVKSWIHWSIKSCASLVNGVIEHYYVRNEYIIFCSLFLSILWVHENCVRDKMLKQALCTSQNQISHGNTSLHMHNHSYLKLHAEGLVILQAWVKYNSCFGQLNLQGLSHICDNLWVDGEWCLMQYYLRGHVRRR